MVLCAEKSLLRQKKRCLHFGITPCKQRFYVCSGGATTQTYRTERRRIAYLNCDKIRDSRTQSLRP